MIYLDSAATSLIKPASVGRAVLRAMRTMASPGRGAHAPAMLAAETVYACREAAALLGEDLEIELTVEHNIFDGKVYLGCVVHAEARPTVSNG